MNTKRIEVTMEITIPSEWSIYQTEKWLTDQVKRGARKHPDGSTRMVQWDPAVEVGMQRMHRSTQSR